jgi:hypothetical protein
MMRNTFIVSGHYVVTVQSGNLEQELPDQNPGQMEWTIIAGSVSQLASASDKLVLTEGQQNNFFLKQNNYLLPKLDRVQLHHTVYYRR